MIMLSIDAGKSLTVTVEDDCPACVEGKVGLDLSPAAFEYFAPLDAGILFDVVWNFIE